MKMTPKMLHSAIFDVTELLSRAEDSVKERMLADCFLYLVNSLELDSLRVCLKE